MSHVLAFDLEGIVPEYGAPAPEKILAGDPRFTTWNIEEREGGLYAGVWEATPGKWRISYDEWEYFRILAGHSIVASETAAEIHLKPGDSLILRPGFKGSWEVVETTRKEYVIRL